MSLRPLRRRIREVRHRMDDATYDRLVDHFTWENRFVVHLMDYFRWHKFDYIKENWTKQAWKDMENDVQALAGGNVANPIVNLESRAHYLGDADIDLEDFRFPSALKRKFDTLKEMVQRHLRDGHRGKHRRSASLPRQQQQQQEIQQLQEQLNRQQQQIHQLQVQLLHVKNLKRSRSQETPPRSPEAPLNGREKRRLRQDIMQMYRIWAEANRRKYVLEQDSIINITSRFAEVVCPYAKCAGKENCEIAIERRDGRLTANLTSFYDHVNEKHKK